MVKISKDGMKVKRRIPFRINQVNTKEMDNCMIYVENFPENLDHEDLTKIFKRAGKIRHVSLPRFKNSKAIKGFAFIEFSTPEEAKKAVQTFNNVIPLEFIEVNSPNYIEYEGDLRPFRVISKEDWTKQK